MENQQPITIEKRVVIRNGNDLYYILKVVRKGYDVICTIPRLGGHHTLHKSGVTHFRGDKGDVDSEKQPPVIMMLGSAGYKQGDDFVVASLKNLNGASGIFTAIYSSVDNLSYDDYQQFNRNIKGCFVIETMLLPKDISELMIGVWAVAKGGEVMFRWNNKDVTESMLFKIEQCEPQIWIYAQPLLE